MDKESVVYILNEIIFSLKNKGTPAICKNMDELGIHYIK